MAHLATCFISFTFLPILLLLLQLQTPQSYARIHENDKAKTEVFLSPKISLQPGEATDKFYYNVDFPRGHIALKSFDAEVVDERGNPVPLHETYLHHWVVQRYYQRKDVKNIGFENPNDRIMVGNSGICQPYLTQYFGIGSETRKTSTYVPNPYGIEVGKPEDIPAGYEEAWILNVHAIDTRGVEDKLGCTECRCDLYNVTVDKYGEKLPENYTGGFRCCHDETRCKLKKGENYAERSLYLRYTVKYIDWKQSILPVKIYIIDVTDVWTKGDESRGIKSSHNCLTEYDVDSCRAGDVCIDTKTLTVDFPDGGDLIYGVGHQHTGAVGTALYGEGGRLMCSSIPTYGQGNEPGDEAGYIVGMSTCYPSPGSVKISAGETLTLVSNYSSEKSHTGVMALFYILVAEHSEKREALHAPVDVLEVATLFGYAWPLALLGGALVVVVGFAVKGRSGGKGGEY